jgi:hypothetical protein
VAEQAITIRAIVLRRPRDSVIDRMAKVRFDFALAGLALFPRA